jgi:uncharacterized membrane protein
VKARRLRSIVSMILTFGVLVSATLVSLCFISSFLVGWRGSLLGDARLVTPRTEFDGLVNGLASLRPQAIAQLGLIALVMTPIARVTASLIMFVIAGDRTYVAITLSVLAILLASVLWVR